MSGAQRTRRPSTCIQLSPKQANIYAWGWQKDARFRYAVCGRRFGKTYLGAEEMRRAYRLAVEHNIRPDTEIWYGAPTFKQGKRVMWNRLKRNIPEDWIQGRPNNAECVIQMKTGHVMRVVGLDDPDALRAKGVPRTHTVVRRRQARARLPSARPRSVAREVGCDSAATAGQCPARSHVFREGYAAHRRQSHT